MPHRIRELLTVVTSSNIHSACSHSRHKRGDSACQIQAQPTSDLAESKGHPPSLDEIASRRRT